MAKRIGVFLDVSNLYYTIRKAHGRNLLYQKYLDYVRDLGVITTARAYAGSSPDSTAFHSHLQSLGLTLITKQPKEYPSPSGPKRKCDFDVEIAVDAMVQAPLLDLVVFGSADGDLLPVVTYLQGKGIKVLVLATGISKDLRDHCHCVEIPASMLEG